MGMYTAAEAVLNWARRRRLQVTWGDADGAISA